MDLYGAYKEVLIQFDQNYYNITVDTVCCSWESTSLIMCCSFTLSVFRQAVGVKGQGRQKINLLLDVNPANAFIQGCPI